MGAQRGPQLVGSEDLTGDRERGEEADHPRQVRSAELDDRGPVAIGAEDPDGAWRLCVPRMSSTACELDFDG